MSRQLVEQRRIHHRGREFHFVSYDGKPANPKRSEPATAAAWWLMSAGTRWEIMPFHPDGDLAEIDLAFREWLDAHVFRSVDDVGSVFP